MTDELGPRLNANEMKVLRFLVRQYSDVGAGFSHFAHIGKGVRLPRAEVRRACRSLKRKGLAEFKNALWYEDGGMYGAGYAATRGAEMMLTHREKKGA